MNIRTHQAWGRRALREANEERRARELDDALDAYGMRPTGVNLERLATARLGAGEGEIVDFLYDHGE